MNNLNIIETGRDSNVCKEPFVIRKPSLGSDVLDKVATRIDFSRRIKMAL
jgi:hypothetical protein